VDISRPRLPFAHEHGPGSGTRHVVGIALAAAIASLASHAAAQTIFRCDDGRGGVLYSDAPCKQGVKVDLLPGKADPAAIERLEREQRAFDARQAARDARADRDAAAARADRDAERQRQAEAARLAAQPPPPPENYYWSSGWPWWYAPLPVVPRPPVRPPRPEPVAPSGFLPATPRLASQANAPAPVAPRPPVRPRVTSQ